MLPGLLRVCVLMLGLSSAASHAQQGEADLADWQRRLLDAIEESGGDPRDTSPEAYRGALDDEAAAEAARKARELYGGRVLAVGRVGEAYRVRLLLDDGRVVTVEMTE